MNIVVVNVNRRGAAVWVGLRWAIRRDADSIVKIGDGIMRDNMARPIDLDGKEASQLVRRIDAGSALAGLIPTDEAHLILAAKEQIIGDYKIAGIGVFGPDAHADIFKAAVAHGEANCSHNF